MTETDDPSAEDGTGKVSSMKARRELMEDGERYIIYYSFSDDEPREEKLDV